MKEYPDINDTIVTPDNRSWTVTSSGGGWITAVCEFDGYAERDWYPSEIKRSSPATWISIRD